VEQLTKRCTIRIAIKNSRLVPLSIRSRVSAWLIAKSLGREPSTVMRELRRNSQPLDRFRRTLLIGYGLMSVVASAVVMRGQGLDWGPIAALILAPLAVVAAIPLVRRAAHITQRNNAE